jgi:hypothetical protein
MLKWIWGKRSRLKKSNDKDKKRKVQMNRKQFIKKIFQTGICGCGAVMGFGQAADQEWIRDLEKKMIDGAETPPWAKVEKAEHWFKSLMENMDTLLDKETKIELMQACGRACFIRAFGVAPEEKPTAEESEKFLQSLKSRGYELKQEKEMVTVIYNWGRDHQNPWGLIMRDGYCMCPLVEKGPPGLSPTFCYCSTGYVKESFQRYFQQTVTVALLDSLKMGGKDCVFKVQISKL